MQVSLFRGPGRVFGLKVTKWCSEKYSTLRGFVAILSAESDAWLEVRNSAGHELKLSAQEGWQDAEDRFAAHLGSVQQ